jgi:hypothetical protein
MTKALAADLLAFSAERAEFVLGQMLVGECKRDF